MNLDLSVVYQDNREITPITLRPSGASRHKESIEKYPAAPINTAERHSVTTVHPHTLTPDELASAIRRPTVAMRQAKPRKNPNLKLEVATFAARADSFTTNPTATHKSTQRSRKINTPKTIAQRICTPQNGTGIGILNEEQAVALVVLGSG
jgi:hypothetical protein